MEKVRKARKTHEKQQNSLKSTTSTSKAFQIKTNSNGNSNNNKPITCYACGETGHKSIECKRNKESLKCTKCKRAGHKRKKTRMTPHVRIVDFHEFLFVFFVDCSSDDEVGEPVLWSKPCYVRVLPRASMLFIYAVRGCPRCCLCCRRSWRLIVIGYLLMNSASMMSRQVSSSSISSSYVIMGVSPYAVTEMWLLRLGSRHMWRYPICSW